jgi:hypothetical protein
MDITIKEMLMGIGRCAITMVNSIIEGIIIMGKELAIGNFMTLKELK